MAGEETRRKSGRQRRRARVDIQVGFVSHEGQRRGHNEDSAALVDLEVPGAGLKMWLCAIADGAGGMASGDLASRLTIEAVKRSLQDQVAASAHPAPGESYGEWLASAVQEANTLVYRRSQHEQTRMASTLVVALVEGQRIHIANVGDSRAYLVRAAGLQRITRDHSAVQELLNAGLITKEQAERHPFEHILTRAIGPEPHVEPDLFTERVHPGDRVLLCSDGLTNMVAEDDIWQMVREAVNPQAAAQALVDAANQAGGKDNITAVVIEVCNASPV